MLERRDDLCFGLETPDEGRVVGEIGTDDLDRHLATDSGLIGAVRRTRRTGADLLAQLVTTHRRARARASAPRTAGAGSDLERLVPDDDLLLEPPKPRRRLDPELLAEPRLEDLVHPQCVGLPRRSVQREHPLTGQRPAGDADGRATPTPRSALGTDRRRSASSRLDRFHSEFLESGDLGLGERLVGELFERPAPPQRQRLTEHERRRRRVDVGECPPSVTIRSNRSESICSAGASMR